MKKTKSSSSPITWKFLIGWQENFLTNVSNLTDVQAWTLVIKRLELSKVIQGSRYFSVVFRRRESVLLSRLAAQFFSLNLIGYPATTSRLKTVAIVSGKKTVSTYNTSSSLARLTKGLQPRISVSKK